MRLLTELESPLDPTALFCRPGPVELEVGTGKGMFLTSVTLACPDRNFVGIEVSAGYARMAASRLASSNTANGLVIHGDAMHLVRHSLPNKSLSGLHVYFPDPWWKARHRKRRILNPEFLEHAGRIMQSGSHLHIWTDVEEYFYEATELSTILDYSTSSAMRLQAVRTQRTVLILSDARDLQVRPFGGRFLSEMKHHLKNIDL